MAAVTTYSYAEAAEAVKKSPGRFQGSDDSNVATHQTVQYMCCLIRGAVVPGCPEDLAALVEEQLEQSPYDRLIVQQAAADSDRFRQWGNSPYASIWWWVKHHVLFVHHQRLLVDWLERADELQLLIRPDCLLKMKQAAGDCAIFTTLICAMLEAAGLDWEICTIACDPRQPGIYSHVYPRVILPNGRHLPMDASHGRYPGWEVPAQHTTAKQIWDRDGNPVEDLGAHFDGLHGVDMNYLYGGSYMPGETRGLGDCDSEGFCDDAGGVVTVTDPTTGETIGPVPIGAGTSSPQGPSLPSSSSSSMSAAEAAVLSNIASAWTKIAGNVIAPQTTIQTPTGLQISTPAGQTANLANILSGSVQLGGSSMNLGSLLLYGGLAVAGLLVVSSMFGKGR